jgi:hypothetical protein
LMEAMVTSYIAAKGDFDKPGGRSLAVNPSPSAPSLQLPSCRMS